MKYLILIIVIVIMGYSNPTYTKRALVTNECDKVNVTRVPGKFKKGDVVHCYKIISDLYSYSDTATTTALIIE